MPRARPIQLPDLQPRFVVSFMVADDFGRAVERLQPQRHTGELIGFRATVRVQEVSPPAVLGFRWRDAGIQQHTAEQQHFCFVAETQVGEYKRLIRFADPAINALLRTGNPVAKLSRESGQGIVIRHRLQFVSGVTDSLEQYRPCVDDLL